MDLARSSLKIAAAKALTLLLTFSGTVFFTQELGATAVGIFFLFQSVLGILTLPANLGTRIAVEKRISEGGPAHRILGTGIVLKSILLIFIALVIFLLQPFLDNFIGSDVSMFLVIAIILHEFAGLTLNVLRGELRAGEIAILQFVYSFTWVTVGSILIIFGYGFLGLIYGVIVGKGVQLLFGIYKTSVKVGYPSRTQAYSLIGYAKNSIIPEVDRQVHNWMDILIIGIFLTQASVGIYEVAWRITSPVLLLTGAIGVTIFPQISSWEAEDSFESIEKLLPKIIVPSLIIVFPAFFGGSLLSKEILGFLFGREFVIGWSALVILLLGKLPQAVRQIVGRSLLGLNRPDLVTHAAVVDIIANIVLNSILIWKFGILGAALGTTLSMTIGTIHRTYYLSRFVNIQLPLIELGWCLLSSIIMFLVLYILKINYSVDSVAKLGAFVALGAILYGIFLVLYSPLRTQIVDQTRAIIS